MSRTTEAVNRIPSQVSVGTLALLCGCFVLSGIAALIYQTAWTRQFAIVFGTSELAVATVLAAYMGGLALGAALAERFLPRVTRPVLTYGLLEIGIAASAIFVVPAAAVAREHRAAEPVRRPADAARQRPRRHHSLLSGQRLRRAGIAHHAHGRDAAGAGALRGRRRSADRPAHRPAVCDEHRGRGRRRAAHRLRAAARARAHAHGVGRRRAQRHRVPARGRAGAAHALREAGEGIFRRSQRRRQPCPARIRKYSFKAFPGTGLGIAADAARGRRGVFPGSAVDAHARRTSSAAASTRSASWSRVSSPASRWAAPWAPRVAKTRERATLALAIALVVAAAAAAVAYLRLESLLPSTAGPAGDVGHPLRLPARAQRAVLRACCCCP